MKPVFVKLRTGEMLITDLKIKGKKVTLTNPFQIWEVMDMAYRSVDLLSWIPYTQEAQFTFAKDAILFTAAVNKSVGRLYKAKVKAFAKLRKALKKRVKERDANTVTAKDVKPQEKAAYDNILSTFDPEKDKKPN